MAGHVHVFDWWLNVSHSVSGWRLKYNWNLYNDVAGTLDYGVIEWELDLASSTNKLHGRLDVLEWLVGRIGLSGLPKDGRTLVNAFSVGNMDILEWWIKTIGLPSPQSQMLCLLQASQSGRVDVLDCLLGHGLSLNDIPMDTRLPSPLDLASGSVQVRVLEWEVEKGGRGIQHMLSIPSVAPAMSKCLTDGNRKLTLATMAMLDWWLKSGLQLQFSAMTAQCKFSRHVHALRWLNTQFKHSLGHGSSAMDTASHTEQEPGLELWYASYELNGCRSIEALNWWENSGLEAQWANSRGIG
ncbi:hypothetical protein BCR44DRAFT_23836 [Catenaria anguillulae PL171]|uniref:Ankyrin repeat-containing domain protein n=1 Tax=Catenaria anguillulae PL171 TaxID=765915 RepID=A0A1Y2HL67_9FUNG|nr:hypothetical protein BCR44DRAFT_23836 [Catenaria anguillulae PL171]